MKKLLTVLLLSVIVSACNAEEKTKEVVDSSSKKVYDIACIYDGFTKHYKTYNYQWYGHSVKLEFTELDGTEYSILNSACIISSK